MPIHVHLPARLPDWHVPRPDYGLDPENQAIYPLGVGLVACFIARVEKEPAPMDMETDLTIRQWLRNRPATVSVFEARVGFVFWDHGEETVGELCRSTGLDGDDLERSLVEVKPVSGLEAWNEKPLYRLVDHLTWNHEAFRDRDLPRMESLLTRLKLELGIATALDALREFRSFSQEFIWHMEEEESFLFPKMLRTEACVHHPEMYPEIFAGSLTAFPPKMQHFPEEAFLTLIASLQFKVRALPLDPSVSGPMREILYALDGFASKLKAHTYLETAILFPKALALEATLGKRPAHHR
jgi:iron-sulfur cluster repair protein YtfE (RIC family)